MVADESAGKSLEEVAEESVENPVGVPAERLAVLAGKLVEKVMFSALYDNSLVLKLPDSGHRTLGYHLPCYIRTTRDI
jgi:hypothetical protein